MRYEHNLKHEHAELYILWRNIRAFLCYLCEDRSDFFSPLDDRVRKEMGSLCSWCMCVCDGSNYTGIWHWPWSNYLRQLWFKFTMRFNCDLSKFGLASVEPTLITPRRYADRHRTTRGRPSHRSTAILQLLKYIYKGMIKTSTWQSFWNRILISF